MEKIKSVFEKIIQYAGICGSLLLILIVLTNNDFKNAGMSVILVSITVFMIYAVFKIIYSANRKPDSVPDLNSGIFVFGFSMIAVAAVFIRMVAFMLVDVDIMGKRALITYVYTILCFVAVYIAGLKLGGHKTGVTSAVIYTILCPFDVYPAMCNLHSGGTKTELIINYASVLIIILSYIAAMFAIKAKTARGASASSVVCGSLLGIGIILHKNSVVAAVCMIIMFILIKASYKYVGGDNMQSRKFKSYKYVLFFLCGYVLFAAGAVLTAFLTGASSMLPKWVVLLKDFDSAVEVFRYADDSLISMWGGIYFERNMFLTYISMLLYLFVFIACALGCRSAMKSKNSKSVFVMSYAIAVSVFGITEGGDVSYIYSVIPLILVIAGYGIANVSKFISIPAYGISENEPITPLEIEQELISKIEKKYMLTEGSAAVCIIAEDDYENFEETDEEDLVASEETSSVNDEQEIECKQSEYVVSGNDLDSMLNNLYGNTVAENTEESQTTKSVTPVDDNNDDSRVIIFKQ